MKQRNKLFLETIELFGLDIPENWCYYSVKEINDEDMIRVEKFGSERNTVC